MANEFARKLRKRLTPQEVKLWVKLRELKTPGFHFRKQSPIGPYIVDFVCFSQAIVVEVDGGQHNLPDGTRKDAERDRFLVAQGFRVLRYWNFDVDKNLDGVLEDILSRLSNPHPTLLRLTATQGHPPHKGEG